MSQVMMPLWLLGLFVMLTQACCTRRLRTKEFRLKPAQP